MKPHSFGSTIILILSTGTFLLLIIFLITNNHTEDTEKKIYFFLSISFLLATFSAYRLGHYNPDQLEEGRIYVFKGQDKKNKILFLSEHIHLEISTNFSSEANPANSIPTSPVDYDELSLYRGQCFSTDIKDGDFVKKHIQEKGVVGIRKLEKEEVDRIVKQELV